MSFLKKLAQRNFIPLLLVFVFAILAGRFLLAPGYFNMHDDLQMMRQLEMEKCFLDGQIPCRWVPDMGYGFGFPLFNFYPPLPYLIGEIFRVFSFSFVDTAKLTFLLSFLVSGATMYLLAKEFFGKWGGLISAIFYIWAPYHSVDIFVRGAMNEAWALCWFPLILWSSYRLIVESKKIKKFVIFLALSWFALLTSHNLMVLVFTPLFGLWCLYFLAKSKSWWRIKSLLISGFLALGFSAFFSLPVLVEQKYVRVDTLVVGYYEYIAHFATLNQLLFTRFWGYGPSVWLEGDGMSFQVGHVHWVLSLITAGILFYLFKFGKKKNKPSSSVFFIIVFFFLAGWFSTFMSHLRSSFIWKSIPLLKIVQFPWRFLTIATFSFSFLAGSLAVLLKEKLAKVFLPFVVILLLVLNWSYFEPEKGKMGPLTDQEKFSGAAWELQQTAGIYDYLPNYAKEAPKEPRKYLAEVMEGDALIGGEKEGTDWAEFEVDVKSEEAVVRIGIFKFPGWRVFVNGQEWEVYVDEGETWGRMYINLPGGEHGVSVKLFNTPIRTAGNLISLATWVGFLGYLIFFKEKKRTLKK